MMDKFLEYKVESELETGKTLKAISEWYPTSTHHTVYTRTEWGS